MQNPNEANVRPRRRWDSINRKTAAALIASAPCLLAGTASAALSTTGNPALLTTYSQSQLNNGVPLDIDGDGNVDFTMNSTGYGATITFHANVVNGFNNLTFENTNGGNVTDFASSSDVLAANVNNAFHTDGILYQGAVGYTAFLNSSGNVGVIFEIPGGSQYYGDLNLSVAHVNGNGSPVTINSVSYQILPEPSSLAILVLGGALMCRRR